MITLPRLLPLVLALTALAAPAPANITVVLSADQAADREALAGIRERAPEAGTLPLKDAGTLAQGVVVAVGPQAASAAYGARVKLVVALVTDPGLHLPPGSVQVSPLPDAFFALGKFRALVPGLKTLAVFTGSGHFQPYIHYLGAVGRVTTTQLRVRSTDSSADVVAGLRSLPGKAQALWLAPEPLLLGSETFQLIANYCRANHVALFAPLPVLAQAGALAGIAPSAREQGRAAGSAALALEQGKSQGASVDAASSQVMINAATAKALGLKVSPGDGELVP